MARRRHGPRLGRGAVTYSEKGATNPRPRPSSMRHRAERTTANAACGVNKEFMPTMTTQVSASFAIKVKDDAVSALVNLGWKKPDAANAVERATRQLDADAPLEVLIKAALAHAPGKPLATNGEATLNAAIEKTTTDAKKPMPATGPTPPPPIHLRNGQPARLPAPDKKDYHDEPKKPVVVGKME